jgi:hypothetical protein
MMGLAVRRVAGADGITVGPEKEVANLTFPSATGGALCNEINEARPSPSDRGVAQNVGELVVKPEQIDQPWRKRNRSAGIPRCWPKSTQRVAALVAQRD